VIEVRIDVDVIQNHGHNILHSILMINALKAAGIPVIGKIAFCGPARGRLIQHREVDLDNDEWVIRWYDDGEAIGDALVPVERGSGMGYSWIRYASGDDL
jgi:hypothetical protein